MSHSQPLIEPGRQPVQPALDWLWLLFLLAAAFAVVGTFYLLTGLWRDPTASLHGMMGSALWTTFGPHLVAVNVLAWVLGALAWRRGLGRPAVAVFSLALVSSVWSVLVVGHLVFAAERVGGEVSLVRSFALEPMTGVEPDMTEVLATPDGQALRIALFKPPHGASAPVIWYIHGGGFMAGSYLETAADLRWLANQGWLVVSAQYRLWTPGQPTWDKAPQDVACMGAWLVAQVNKHGGDMSRLAILGDSAGGNLAINYAYAQASGQLHSPCGDLPSARVVVVQYPAVDPLAIYERGFPVPGFEPKMLMEG